MIEGKPKTVRDLINNIDHETYQRLKTAVEIGKWESGETLGREQIEYCVQAIIGYEEINLHVDQRVGYIALKKSKIDKPSGGSATITSDRINTPDGIKK